jgi:predicted nucleic acid-binding protein
VAGIVVLDAGALIGLFDRFDPHHKWAMEMLRDTSSLDLATSALTYAESRVQPARAGKQSRYESAFHSLGAKIYPLEPEYASDLAKIRSDTGLKMPDAVVLQLTLQLGAELATTDKLLAKVAHGLKIGVFQPR